MKHLYLVVIMALLTGQLSAGDTRVASISLVKKGYNRTDTTVYAYYYIDGKMTSYSINKNSYKDSVVISYNNNSVNEEPWVFSSKMGNWKKKEPRYAVVKTFEGDKLAGLTSSSKIYKMEYKDGKIVQWTEDIKSDRPVYRYYFNYGADGKLENIESDRLSNGDWINMNSRYVRTYEGDKLIQVSWMNSSQETERYELVWDGDKLQEIKKYRFGNPDGTHLFYYNDQGNIIREEIKNAKDELLSSYIIEYEPGSGNDDIFFGVDSWYNYKLNAFMGIPTYEPHIDYRY